MRTGPREWFGVGARLIGLWLLTIAFTDLRAAFYVAAGWSRQGSIVVSFTGFVAQATVGLILLLAGGWVAGLLYPDRPASASLPAEPGAPQPAPPDWYPDPSGAGGLRYWDGQAWSAHTLPAAPPEPTTERPLGG